MGYHYVGTYTWKVGARTYRQYIGSNCWVASSGTNCYYIKADENGNALPVFYVKSVEHPITFGQYEQSIETMDGETGNINCTRSGTYPITVSQKYIAYEDEVELKRDWSDMTAAEGTTYAPWMLSELDGITADPAVPLNWKTFNISGVGEVQGWVSEVPVATDLYCVIRPEYSNLYQMYKELNGSYTIMTVTPITFSEDGLSITSYDGDPSAITCSRSSSSAIPIQTTLATTLDIEGFEEKRDYQDITYPASIDNTGKYSIDHFTLTNGASTVECDQFTQGSGTSTWRDLSMNYSIATTDGTNFTLSDTTFGGSGTFTIDGYPSQIEVQVFNTATQSQI